MCCIIYILVEHKERHMKGTIRIVAGLLITMGAVGGMDADTATLSQGMSLAALGLALLAWGVYAVNQEEQNA
jgi:hypothetical protein